MDNLTLSSVVTKMENCKSLSEVASIYKQFLLIFDKYQEKNLETLTTTCNNGCSYCCNHWVEDVYNFEAIIIVERIKESHSNLIPKILETIDIDTEIFNELSIKYSDEQTLLLKFYEKERRCPLLDDNNSCSVYDIRPLTCRSFFSRSHPKFCAPKYVFTDDVQHTFMETAPELIADRLDNIHLKFKWNYGISLRESLGLLRD